MNLQQLSEAINRARKAGREAADTCPNDGGSANLDSLYLYDLRGVRESAMNNAGIHCRRKGPDEFFLSGAHFGQGNRNTAGVEAMYKSLNAEGIKCSIWYQMD